MPNDRKLFRIVVLLGVVANWAFGVWAIGFDTASLLAAFHLGGVVSTVWIYNYSVLLMILSLFYIPAALDPDRYRVNAWLLVVGRLVPASTFFIGVAMGYMPAGFARLGVGDTIFGALELFLLLRIVREPMVTVPAPA